MSAKGFAEGFPLPKEDVRSAASWMRREHEQRSEARATTAYERCARGGVFE